MITVKEARELQNIGELNKAVDEAERYIDNCIKHSAVTKEIVEVCLYDDYHPKSTEQGVKNTVYYAIPDGTLGQIIQGHWLREEHIEEFHKRILNMYDEAGYQVSYQRQKVGENTQTYVFKINGFK